MMRFDMPSFLDTVLPVYLGQPNTPSNDLYHLYRVSIIRARNESQLLALIKAFNMQLVISFPFALYLLFQYFPPPLLNTHSLFKF